MSIVVTAATGALGRLVVEELLERVPADRVAVVVRNEEKAADLAARGIEVRVADYDDPAALARAFRPGDRVLLISGNEIGRRVAQHTAVIDAAKAAGVAQLAYTGILGGPEADFELAAEHTATERAVLASGLPYTFLRNGWYHENYTRELPTVLGHGAVVGSSGEGRVASAARADYAAAAAVALTGEGHLNRIYELSGDAAWSLGEYAAEVSALSGKEIAHADVPADEHLRILTGAGVPEGFAAIIVDVDAAIARGRLAGTSGDLARLIGRPTTPVTEAIGAALA
ncbi:NAD(P)-dependent oxidoreductase [Streptomyces virginiae]|uniref:NAD(P)-dependent oxidoreductase n=1 Tax=Streptomyces virginiae TaxID=1961 RepID=A0ABQ3NTM9_STRVG|nr:SDR family oxidoreductase [Streptomyces virginiae]MBP2345824.1 NAD(P)H dehydrogenase (quinone) [Streptomyces virginiae]GGQ13364.1 NAD(P)-dependent oxidoreductase [Streptomyces virginiae]GHI16116.1 NAD(P)-dependent oxidoreductase [Streptomyces virginiae]